MASAKKCDRCGSLYELSLNSNKRDFIVAKYYNFNGNNGNYYDIDFCDKCQNEFINWLKEKGEFSNL